MAEENAADADTAYKTAVLAGGCFWCVESEFDSLTGVVRTISGYTGGHVENPTYADVSSGKSGHREVVLVAYDPSVIGYEDILARFWRSIDPFDAAGQFVDKGPQYTTAIYYSSEEEKDTALRSKAGIEEKFGKPVVTEILPLGTFYVAEAYHQDFHKKSPERYRAYSLNNGRLPRLERLWGKDAE